MSPFGTSRGSGSGVDRIGRAALLIAAIVVVGETIYYRRASGYYDAGIEFVLRFYNVSSVREYVVRHLLTNPYYPPLYFAVLLATYLVAGTEFLPHVLVGDAMILGGAWLLYRALVRRGVERGVAGIAVAAFLLLPGVVIFGRTLLIEQPMMVLLPACILLADRAEGFRDARAGAGLGACLALGVLTKWSFLAYATVPLAATVAATAWTRDEPTAAPRGRLPGLLAFAAVFLVLAGPWYFGRFDPALMLATANNDPSYPTQDFFRNLAHNLGQFRALAGTPVLLALAVAAGAALRAFPSRGWTAAWIASVAVPLLFFSWPRHLEDRYLYPILVFAPLVAAVPAVAGWRRAVAWVLAVGFLIAAIVAHAGAWRPAGDASARVNPLSVPAGHLFWGKQRTREILDAVDRDAGRRGLARAVVAVHPLWTDYHVAPSVLQYESRRGRRVTALSVLPFAKFDYLGFAARLRGGAFDYVVVDCGVPGVCSDAPASTVRLRPQDRMDTVYVDQRTGNVQGTYTEAQVQDDLAFLRTSYERVLDLDLGAGQRVWIYRKPR